jgi:acetylglutamate kinase
MAAMYLADAQQIVEAAEMIATFGEQAPVEAAIRAGRMRDIGNHVHFCRWRQTERLIAVLASDAAIGTVH